MLESDAIEGLALEGGLAGLLALVDLPSPARCWPSAPAAFTHGVTLLASLALVAVAGHVYLVRRRAWTARRLALTDDLVETMLAHQTRLAQEPPAGRGAVEDHALAGYLGASRRLERVQRW